MRIIHLNEVQNFVKNTLKRELQKDLRKRRILKEGDVECCSYYHLRKFLKPDPDWHVFARKHSPRTGFYTDLMILHGAKPKIAIELKWRKRCIPKKDRDALASARKNLGVKKTYFYCVMPDASHYEKLSSRRKRTAEKYRLFERVVDLGYQSRRKIEEFQQQRREFRPRRNSLPTG
jgi:hypothetical protein